MLTDTPSSSENIQVAVRVRPPSEQELQKPDARRAWFVEGNSILDVNQINSFSFDKIFSEDVKDNNMVFIAIGKPLVESALDGFNGTVFAYGQTSAGKTFTMKGAEGNPGLLPLSLEHIFASIEAQKGTRQFALRCSYLEIYNEAITDLLNASDKSLKIHESLSAGVFVGNLSEEPVLSIDDALGLLTRGEEKRTVGSTNMNDQSSRSHTIFKIIIESRETAVGDEERESMGCGAVKISTLTFVDLAGSERVGLTGAEGQQLKEGGHINKSLLALTSVISKLSEQSVGPRHIPYRDSKLTRILQPSLGGNSKTAIICNITPSAEYAEESLSTLKFAARAKTIRNRARVNEFVSDKEMIRWYQEQIAQLHRELESCHGGAGAKKRKIESPEDFTFIEKLFSDLRNSIQEATAQEADGIAKITNELFEEISFLKLELGNNMGLYAEQNQQVLAIKGRIAELEASHQGLMKERDEALVWKEKFEEAEAKCHQLGSEMASVEEALMDDLARMNTENEGLKSTVKQLEAAISAGSDSCLNCRQVNLQIDELCDVLTALEEEIRKTPKQADIDTLEITYQKKLDVKAAENAGLFEEISALKSDLAGRDNDIITAMETITGLKKAERTIAEKYEGTIDQLNAKVMFLEAELERAMVDKRKLLEKDKSHSDQVTELNDLIIALKSEIDRLDTLNKELSHEKQRLEGSTAEMMAAMQDGTSKSLAQLNTITNLQADLLTNAKLIEQLRSDLSTANTKLVECNGVELKIQDLVAQLAAQAQIRLGLEEMFKGAESSNAQLKTNIDELEARLAAQVDPEKLQAEHEESITKVTEFWKAQLSAFKQDKENEIKQVTSQFQAACGDLEAVRGELSIIKNKLELAQDDAQQGVMERKRVMELLERANGQKASLEERIRELEPETAQPKAPENKSKEVLLRIELEKSRDTFNKEKKLLLLKINDLEDQLLVQAQPKESSVDESVLIDLTAKNKRLEEENFRLNQLYNAGLHKIDYYASIINNRKYDESENIKPRAQAFDK